MKIGIPKALLYYYYYPLWKVLFEELGFEVVTTKNTTKELVDKGIKVSVSDICVPIKIFNGHVLELLEQSVDYIFVPRMMNIRKGEFFCPKFMGLPDMVRYCIPDIKKKLLAPNISSVSDDISDAKNYLPMCDILGVSSYKMRSALKKGKVAWEKYRRLSIKGHTAKEVLDSMESGNNIKGDYKGGFMNIGLMSYVYNLYDEFISMGMVDRLRERNISIQTFEMFNENVLDSQLRSMRKILFWTFSNKLLAVGYKFLKDSRIDGIIHITAFGCGPDSLIGKVMELESIDYGKPFMTIRVDEHTGENHLQTRVEAFIDMIYRKKVMLKGEASIV